MRTDRCENTSTEVLFFFFKCSATLSSTEELRQLYGKIQETTLHLNFRTAVKLMSHKNVEGRKERTIIREKKCSKP